MRMFHGGFVKENGEFERMNEQVELFSECPSFKDVVDRVMRNHGCGLDEVTLRGRFDCGKARSHYVMIDLSSESEWNQYKDIVASANVACYEIVVDIRPRERPSVREDDVQVPIENLTQESIVSQQLGDGPTVNINVHDGNSNPFDFARALNDFDAEVFEQEEEEVDDDDISTGSERDDYEFDVEEEERNVGLHDEIIGGYVDEVVEEEDDRDDGGPANVSAESVEEEENVDDGGGFQSRGVETVEDEQPYTAREMAMLKKVDVIIPPVANDKDISMCDKAVCRFQMPTWETLMDVENPRIYKGMKFSSFEELKFYLADYAVRVFRPFSVVHSDKNLRYDIICKQGCMWRVWARLVRSTGQWKISRVVEPHTCRSSLPKQKHAQCTARYISRRVLGIIEKDNDAPIPSLIESIFAFSSYRVTYSKAWRAKQHALAILWGDWAESYGRVPRVLTAMAHFNPGIKWFPYTSGEMQPGPDGVYKYVLTRVFWCFPQCSVSFEHCRPVILVDGTFLTGKYKGTLLMAVAVDPETQLVPVAFAIAEAESVDSWSWFMQHVRRHVLGPLRQVCMISDRHIGLLKCAEEQMNGYPPLIHRWCMRHFAANMWRRQRKKEVIEKLKALCGAHTEKDFDDKLKALLPDLNHDAKEWLEGEMGDKDKWALAFDEGGKRYGIMTTNYAESMNHVFKGIRSRPVAGIVAYSFTKCNEYFVDRYRKFRILFDHGDKWGYIAEEHLEGAEGRSVHQIGQPHGPEAMIYSVQGSGGTTIGGESYGGRHYRLDLRTGDCSCMVPQLYHLPCSHIITACRARGLDYTCPLYMSPFYARENTLKVWESTFEPYLDPSQWPPYEGLEYVADVTLKKTGKGRRSKKRIKGAMDELHGGRASLDFSTGDFDEKKSENRCSKCHKLKKNCTCKKKKTKRKKRAKRSSSIIVAFQVEISMLLYMIYLSYRIFCNHFFL